MADFVCLQYTTDQQNGSENTSSFRRSLNSNLFGRRSMNSRSNNNSGIETQQESVYIRIVPHIDNPSRSLVFSIIERDLEAGHVIRVGRFTDRIATQNHISFKSKVVSRTHCEIWLNNDGKVLIKDTKSSSGTFINHIRLSPTNQESRAVEVRDGDIVQLGVDYQGGLEEIYRAVKMKFEINRPTQDSRPISYSMSAYNNLRNLTSLSHNRQTATTMDLDHSSDSDEEAEHRRNHVIQKNTMCHNNEIEVEECCICLYALAPFQALFVAPCSHSYHFKCIRPLFDSYPGFQCPICRTYSDLDASVAVETEEVMEKFGLYSGKRSVTDKSSHGCEKSPISKIISQSNPNNEEGEEEDGEIPCSSNPMVRQRSQQQQQQSSSFSSEPPLSTTLVTCHSNFSGVHPTEIQSHSPATSGTEPQDQANNAGDHRATILFEDSANNVTNEYHQSSSTEEENDDNQPIMISSRMIQHQPNNRRYNNNSNNLVEKIKLAFSPERRKSTLHKKHNRDEDVRLDRSETVFDMPSTSNSSSPPSSPRVRHSLTLTQTQSRQSIQNAHLNEIIEEGTVIQRDRL